MNDMVISERQQLSARPTVAQLMLDPRSMSALQHLAETMAQGRATVPAHLQGKPADMLAIIMQSAAWGMDPWGVARKTHVTQGGVLGYEAQLINAVVINNAPIRSRPEFEFFGDWSRIIGRVTENTGKTGGKYYTSAWSKADEAGLGVICRATLIGEDAPREVEVLLSQCWPRFSTQWATDPQQQITYAAIRKWARRYAPDVLLGVMSTEEAEIVERDITPPPESAKSPLLIAAEREAAKGINAYQQFFQGLGKDARRELAPDHDSLKAAAAQIDERRAKAAAATIGEAIAKPPDDTPLADVERPDDNDIPLDLPRDADMSEDAP